MSHSILLIQPSSNAESRTYSDYESVNDCLEGVCRIYEEHLKRRNPSSATITWVNNCIKVFFLIIFIFIAMTLVNFLTLLINWEIWVASCIRNRQTHMLHTTRNGLRKRSMCYFVKLLELTEIKLIFLSCS